jgi:opacity protein-like surface antigen
MRKLRILVVVIISFVTFSASAQIGIGGTVGLTLPMGDFGNGLNTGFGFNAIGKYSLSNNMAVGISLGYSSFGTGSENLSYGVIPITGLFEYSFGSGAFKPYLGTDLGLYMFRSKFSYTLLGTTTSNTNTDTYFGFAPTGGVMYEISNNLSICGNLKYNMVFAKDALDNSTTSTWLGINAGVIFKLGK